MSGEFRARTHPIEYVIGGLCAWHTFGVCIYGVLQLLGVDQSVGWATFIALVITVAALVKIRKDDWAQLRPLPQDGPLAQLFAKEGGEPPQALSPAAPLARLPPTARTEPKRRVSAADYFAGVFAIWMLAMLITALVVTSIGWASLIGLGITSCALLAIQKRLSTPRRVLPPLGAALIEATGEPLKKRGSAQ